MSWLPKYVRHAIDGASSFVSTLASDGLTKALIDTQFPRDLELQQLTDLKTYAPLLHCAYYTAYIATAFFGAGALYSAALLWEAVSLTATISFVLCEELCREACKIARVISPFLAIIEKMVKSQQIQREDVHQVRKTAVYCLSSLWFSKIPSIQRTLNKVTAEIPEYV